MFVIYETNNFFNKKNRDHHHHYDNPYLVFSEYEKIKEYNYYFMCMLYLKIFEKKNNPQPTTNCSQLGIKPYAR